MLRQSRSGQEDSFDDALYTYCHILHMNKFTAKHIFVFCNKLMLLKDFYAFISIFWLYMITFFNWMQHSYNNY